MTFDFSGLKRNPPPGMIVRSAATTLELVRKRETEPPRFFTVTNRNGKFQLWHRTDMRLTYKNPYGDLLLERADLFPILRLLGYAHMPKPLTKQGSLTDAN